MYVRALTAHFREYIQKLFTCVCTNIAYSLCHAPSIFNLEVSTLPFLPQSLQRCEGKAAFQFAYSNTDLGCGALWDLIYYAACEFAGVPVVNRQYFISKSRDQGRLQVSGLMQQISQFELENDCLFSVEELEEPLTRPFKPLCLPLWLLPACGVSSFAGELALKMLALGLQAKASNVAFVAVLVVLATHSHARNTHPYTRCRAVQS